MSSAQIPKPLLDQLREAFLKASAQTEQELHAPSAEWPNGFYSKDDHLIVFDAGMTATLNLLKESRPKIVCICGSSRDHYFHHGIAMLETLKGHIVLSMCVFGHSNYPYGAQQHCADQLTKDALDKLHLAKIDLADEVLILNPGQYIGHSTLQEIKYARAQGKAVRYYEPVHDELKTLGG